MGRTVVRQIQYSPLPAQLRFHQSRKRFRIFTGPVGSGKSAALAQECIKCAVMNPGLPGLLGAPTYRMLEDVTKPALIEVLVKNEIPHRHAKADNTIELSDTGTKIFCRSLEVPERLVGTNLAFFGIDEQTYTKEASFLRLQARLRHPQAKFLTGFGACTPNGFDWVYDRFIGDKKSDDYEAIQASPRENYHLPVDYYDTLAKSYDPRFFRQEVLGEFLSLQGGSAYYAFDRSINIDAEIRYKPTARLVWTLDFNVNPMASVIAQLTERVISGKLQPVLETLDEIVLRDANVNMACAEFIERTKRWAKPNERLKVNIYGDPAGNSRSHAGKSDWQLVYDYFGRHGEYQILQNVASSHSLVRDRINAVNGALRNAVGETRIYIHPQCKDLIRDFERVVWAKDSHGNSVGDLNKSDPQLTHVSDAAGYAIERIFPLANRVHVSVI